MVFSIYICVALFFGILTGQFFDVEGPRKPILLGAILTFVGVFAMANCTSLYQFVLSFSIVAGLGGAVQSSSLIGIISHYFYRRRGLAVGLATVGGSVGGAVFPLMLRKLYQELGFKWAIRIFAFVLAACNLAAFALISPRFPPKKSQARHHSLWYKALIAFLLNQVDFEAFKDMRFLFACLGVSFSELFLVIANTYIVSYALHQGNSENTSYLYITIINACGIAARVFSGYFSDKLGKYNLMIVMVFFSALFSVVVWLPFGHLPIGLYMFSVCYGIASAAVLSLSPVCISQITRVETFGKRYTTCYIVVALYCLVGLPLSGLFIGTTGSDREYSNFIVFVSILGFMGSLCWLVSRYCAVNWKLCIY